MSDQSEWELDRLTPAGWTLLVVASLTCCVIVPFVLVWLCPDLLVAGGAIQRYTIIAGFLVLMGGIWLSCKWLLEQCGVTVLRPVPEPTPRPVDWRKDDESELLAAEYADTAPRNANETSITANPTAKTSLSPRPPP